MKVMVFILFLAINFNLTWCQNSNIIYIFNLDNKSVDSIDITTFQDTVSNTTPSFTGLYNKKKAPLPTTPPVTNVFQNSNFSKKEKVSNNFDLLQYPIRCAVRLYYKDNDTLKGNCSGILISQKHVLSAAHCISGFGTNEIFHDHVFAKLAEDWSNNRNPFGIQTVQKVYLFKNWGFNGTDIALFELDQPIGTRIGWVGIGYNNDDNFFYNELFYKFSYPGGPALNGGANYNGDTLYYNYGYLNDVLNSHLGVNNGIAAPGESGSSILNQSNNNYISYGVLSIAYNMRHTRINKKVYNAFYQIIKDHLKYPPKETPIFHLHPNPTQDHLYFDSRWISISIYDTFGKLVLRQKNSQGTIDVSSLSSGVYIIKAVDNNRIFVSDKIVKL